MFIFDLLKNIKINIDGEKYIQDIFTDVCQV